MGNNMRISKSMILGIVAIGAILGTNVASAADLRTKAPPMVAPEPAITWTGFYGGLNFGAVWARSDVTDVNAYAAAATPGTVTSISTGARFLIGGQIGYNWQISNVVFGIEGDGGWMDIGSNPLLTGTGSGTRVGLNTGGSAYGDITGRLGVTFDRALLYVKGGYAVIDKPSTFSTVSGSFSGLTMPRTDSGYTIGGGVEYKFTPNWSVKLEYLHFDFGHTLNYTVFNAGGTPFLFNQNLRLDTIKVGANFTWGGPIVARY
jgi:outer membrane immunogenic protein